MYHLWSSHHWQWRQYKNTKILLNPHLFTLLMVVLYRSIVRQLFLWLDSFYKYHLKREVKFKLFIRFQWICGQLWIWLEKWVKFQVKLGFYLQKLMPLGLHLIIANSKPAPKQKNSGGGIKYTNIGFLRNKSRSVYDINFIRKCNSSVIVRWNFRRSAYALKMCLFSVKIVCVQRYFTILSFDLLIEYHNIWDKLEGKTNIKSSRIAIWHLAIV